MLVIAVCTTMFMQSFNQTGRHPYMHTYMIYYTKKYTPKLMNFNCFLKRTPQQSADKPPSQQSFQIQVHGYGLWF